MPEMSAVKRKWTTLAEKLAGPAWPKSLDQYDPKNDSRPIDLLAEEKLTPHASIRPFVIPDLLVRTASREALVSVDGSRYSVPPSHACQKLTVLHRPDTICQVQPWFAFRWVNVRQDATTRPTRRSSDRRNSAEIEARFSVGILQLNDRVNKVPGGFVASPAIC